MWAMRLCRALIASISEEYNEGAWADLVGQCEEAGVDGFELNLSCPQGLPERGMGMAIGQDNDKVAVRQHVATAACSPVASLMSPLIAVGQHRFAITTVSVLSSRQLLASEPVQLTCCAVGGIACRLLSSDRSGSHEAGPMSPLLQHCCAWTEAGRHSQHGSPLPVSAVDGVRLGAQGGHQASVVQDVSQCDRHQAPSQVQPEPR